MSAHPFVQAHSSLHAACNGATQQAPASASAAGAAEYEIVLKPLSHPGLDDISIEENLFAVGRTEPPFASYAPEVVADLSRRHARIFCEYGAVFIADLDSKNGTTVNGVDIQQKISRLHDGDEICFGRGLSYRVHLGNPVRTQQGSGRLAGMALTPQREDAGIQPIVITQFPFLISKADDAFAQYKNAHPHQVHYLSRRHAHIFLKSGAPWVEDLGSTNGTFVNDRRLDEHAVQLQDGDVLAFGGHHFVYTVSLRQAQAIEPTVTRLSPGTRAAPAAAAAPADAFAAGAASERTTFVAAADSFLDIFCIEAAAPEPEAEAAAPEPESAGKTGDRRRRRGRLGTLLQELQAAFQGGAPSAENRSGKWMPAGLAAMALIVAAAGAAYWNGNDASRLKDLIAAGEYRQAAQDGQQAIARSPDDATLRALAIEALLKAHVPGWLQAQKAGDFQRAAAILKDMERAGTGNPEAGPLIAELQWLGRLQSFLAGRPRDDAPVRLFTDEEAIKSLLAHWDQDTPAHQRALGRIASHVPEFAEPYAALLSRLRSLQAENAVYLAAMERLKAVIADELGRGRPEELAAVFDEYAEKYPRIAGLDALRADLRRYLPIDAAVRRRDLGALSAHLSQAEFATPPFRARMQALAAQGLPAPEVLQQYRAVSAAWQAGDGRTALARLRAIKAGDWADGAAGDAARKQALLEQFDALSRARDVRGQSGGQGGQEERLLIFYGMLDPLQDRHYAQAAAPLLAAGRERMLKAAQQRLASAETLWAEYQVNGGIDPRQRQEPGVSDRFRAQAGLLARASQAALQGMRVQQQLGAETPPQWQRLAQDIQAEQGRQMRGLSDPQQPLRPDIAKAKLVLLTGGAQ